MPDWIKNRLFVIGSVERLREFLDRKFRLSQLPIEDEDELFNFETQMPFEYEGEEYSKKYWNAKDKTFGATRPYNTHLTMVQNGLLIEFETQWNPPNKWFKHIVEKFPDLEFEMDWKRTEEVQGKFVGVDGVTKNYAMKEE